MSSKKAIALLALILLLALSFMFSDKGKAWLSNKGSSSEIRFNAEGLENDKSTRSSRRNQATSKVRPKPTHTYGELKDFMIPELKVDNITFNQALYQLRDSYYEICLRTGEKPIPFKFTVEEPSQRTINITLKNLSFTNMLETLAAIEGMKMETENRQITFTHMKKSGTLYTQTLTVPPGLLEKLKRNSSGLYSVEPNISGENGTLQKVVAQRFKELMALEGAAISYAPSTLQLIVNADARDLKRIEQIIDHYLAVPPSQIKTSTQTIVMDDNIPFDPSWVNQPEAMSKFYQTPGVDVVTSPSVISLSGESSTVEVIRESPNRTNNRDWTGYKITNQTSFLGFGMNGQTFYDRGMRSDTPESPIVHNKTTQDAYVQRGNVQVILLKPVNGRRSYLLVTHQEIDATGQPIQRDR